MTDYNNDLEALFSSLAQETEKVAEAVEINETVEAPEAVVEDHEKIAEDLRAGGEILANAFVDSVLEKLAAAVPAAPMLPWQLRPLQLRVENHPHPVCEGLPLGLAHSRQRHSHSWATKN